jgi:hypothetical protein
MCPRRRRVEQEVYRSEIKEDGRECDKAGGA